MINMKKKKMRETDRYSHHKCPKCGYEWNEHEMIFETDNDVMKVLHRTQ